MQWILSYIASEDIVTLTAVDLSTIWKFKRMHKTQTGSMYPHSLEGTQKGELITSFHGAIALKTMTTLVFGLAGDVVAGSHNVNDVVDVLISWEVK